MEYAFILYAGSKILVNHQYNRLFIKVSAIICFKKLRRWELLFWSIKIRDGR